jgi:MFS family permease
LGKVNVAVGVLFAPAIAGIFVAFQLAQSRGWLDYAVIATLIAALATLTFWGWHQTRQAFPLIQVRSLAERQILLANICICLLALGCMQNGQVISLFLQQPVWTHTGFGFPAITSGALMFAVLSIALIASPMSGAIAARYGARRAALLGFSFGVAGWLLNALHHDTLWLFVAACMLGSVCVAVVQPAVFNLVIEATGEERTSEAIGLCNVVLSISVAVGSQLLSALLASSTVNNPAYGVVNYPSDGAYSITFAYIAMMSILGFVTASSISRPSAALPETGWRPSTLPPDS